MATYATCKTHYALSYLSLLAEQQRSQVCSQASVFTKQHQFVRLETAVVLKCGAVALDRSCQPAAESQRSRAAQYDSDTNTVTDTASTTGCNHSTVSTTLRLFSGTASFGANKHYS